MGEVRWLDGDQQRAWRGWLEAHTELAVAMNRQLQRCHGLSISDYEILVALTDVDDRTLRMYELGQKVKWEKSRLSKQVSRMAARGLVARDDVPGDRRGAFVRLTDQGYAAIRDAAPGHADLVRSVMFDGLSHDQVRTLGDITAAVLERVREHSSFVEPRPRP